VLTLPEGEDPDSCIRNHGRDAYHDRIAQASSFIEYLIDRGAARHAVGTPRGKADFLNEVLPTLARIPNHVERVAHVSRLAERAEITDVAVVEELRRKVMQRAREVKLEPERGESLRPAERDLVRWLLHSPPDAQELLSEIDDEDLGDLLIAPILKAMKEVASSDELSTERVMDRLSAERDRNLMTRIALEPSPLGPRQSPRDCLNRLREQRWRRQLSRLRARLAQGLEDETIAAEIQTLARRIETLSRIEKLA
jgi:DNA primase